jgi:shikimate dehydrogenase
LFLKKGEEQGANIKNGLDMLKILAEENWKIWNS